MFDSQSNSMGGIAVVCENPERGASRCCGLWTQVLRVKVGQSLGFAGIGVGNRRGERNLSLKYVYGLFAEIGSGVLAAAKDSDGAIFHELKCKKQCHRRAIRTVRKYSIFPFPWFSLKRKLFDDSGYEKLLLFRVIVGNKIQPAQGRGPACKTN